MSKPIRVHKLLSIGALAGALMITLAGCATAEQSGEQTSSAPAASTGLSPALYAKAVTAAKKIADDKRLGGSIEVVGGNTGSEAGILEGVYKAFTEATGTKVNYTGTGSGSATATAVATRVKGGNAPDIAQINIGIARGYAKQGKLMDVSSVVGQGTLSDNYSDALLTDSSSDHKVMGIFQDFSTFAMWINPTTYNGPDASTATWGQTVAWTKANAAAGKPTWCMAMEAGAGSGFPNAQLVEQIFAKKYGPKMLEKWGSGELSWTSPEVKWAFQQLGEIATDKSVDGGIAASLSQSVADGPLGLVSSPTKCLADDWGSWVPGIIGDKATSATLDFMPLPASDPSYANTEIFQAPITVAFTTNDKTTAFMKYIASYEAQSLLASADHWTVADKKVSADSYTNPLLKKAAEHFFSPDTTLAIGPNVLATAAVGDAFNKGIMSYMSDPSSLDSVLTSIQAAAQPN